MASEVESPPNGKPEQALAEELYELEAEEERLAQRTRRLELVKRSAERGIRDLERAPIKMEGPGKPDEKAAMGITAVWSRARCSGAPSASRAGERDRPRPA